MWKRISSHIRQMEFGVLLGWLVLTGTLWLFLALGSEIREGETGTLDRALMLALRGADNPFPSGTTRLYSVMRDFTALGGFVFLVLQTIVLALALSFHRRWRAVLTLLGTAIGAQLSIEILKLFYDRPRPFEIVQPERLYSTSFPSGHTAEATAIFLTAAIIVSTLQTQFRIKVLAFAVAIFAVIGVGVSRVYLGVHWPSDVLGGWFLGSAWALAGWIFLNRPFSVGRS